MQGSSRTTNSLSDNHRVGVVSVRYVTEDEPRSFEIRYRQAVEPKPRMLKIQYLDDEFEEPRFVSLLAN